MIQMISTWMVRQRIPLQKVFVTVTMPTVGILPWLKMEQTWKLSMQLSKQLKLPGKPSLIEVKTVIGYGSPNKQGTNAYMVLLLEQMKLQQLVKRLVGTMNHLKFQNKFMLISKNMLQTVAHQLMKLGQN